MKEAEIGKIAESAFRSRFGGVDVVAVVVKPDPDPLDGDPAVWADIVHDGDVERLTGDGMAGVQIGLPPAGTRRAFAAHLLFRRRPQGARRRPVFSVCLFRRGCGYSALPRNTNRSAWISPDWGSAPTP